MKMMLELRKWEKARISNDQVLIWRDRQISKIFLKSYFFVVSCLMNHI
jgi:hypothetical protein